MKEQFYQHILDLQNKICLALEKSDGKAKFREDIWERPEGGGGFTRVIENGAVLDKGGVNVSKVHGKLHPEMAAKLKVESADFLAMGLSLVIHPKNPFAPTVHANWRYFEMYNEAGEITKQWFGGGQDLTPYYLFDEDAKHFHAICKNACDRHDKEYYPKYKKWCDEYFYNSHRNEARGIGGLFFDYLKPTQEKPLEHWFDFVADIGNSFVDAYIPILEKRKRLAYTQKEKDWQEIRRGRYVEFNLIHDRGTLFGLKTNGRIESIFMSLPPKVQWHYDYHPTENSKEWKLEETLKNPREWV